MHPPKTKDFLIRGMPVEVYKLLEKISKENHRSKTQEAILALTAGLSLAGHKISRPKPFQWKTKVTEKFIEDAINEGRE